MDNRQKFNARRRALTQQLQIEQEEQRRTVSPTEKIEPIQAKKIRRGLLASTKIEEYDQKHKDSRGFVIGGGPSIKKIQERGFNFLKLEDEITVGVNKAYKLFVPTYLIFGDAYFFRKFGSEIQKVDCLKIAPVNVVGSKAIPQLLPLRRAISASEVLPKSFGGTISFINNSGVAALRVAYLLGLNPIYLVGFDIGPNVAGETHFHKDYAADKDRITKPQRYQQFLDVFRDTIKALKEQNVEVFSCSETSRLNEFLDYVPIESLFIKQQT